MKTKTYLFGCIREIGYEINLLNAQPVPRYGADARAHRIGQMRNKIAALHAEIAAL